MGIFDRFMRKNNEQYLNAEQLLKVITGYQASFTSWNGAIYESARVRSAIDARARHISKLKIESTGKAKQSFIRKLKVRPNNWMTWSQFLYRASTILDNTNTLCIAPIVDQFNQVQGYIPLNPMNCQLVKTDTGDIWVRYQFSNGVSGAIEWDRVATMTKFQFRNDFFGEGNQPLNETMELIHLQSQAIEEGIKSTANIKFLAKLTNFSKAEDLKKEQERFNENHLTAGKGGLLLFPNTYDSIQQINYKAFVVDAEQMKLIDTNIDNYFGVNEDILQNKAFGDKWSAFYEGCVEVFAIQFSEVMTRAIFTEGERMNGNQIIATSNRLQYLSNADKLAISRDMADRGLMSINEIREIWNLPALENGDKFIIRGEYYNSNEKLEGSEDGQGTEQED